MAIFNTIYSVEETLVKWWSPKMTSNNAPTPYVAEADSEYVSMNGEIYSAYKAFDNNLDTTWYSASPSDRWLLFDVGNSIEVKGVQMLPDGTLDVRFFPKEVSISGSNDGTNWDAIITDDGVGYDPNANEWRVIMFDNAVTYRYFKFNFGLAYNNYVQSIVCEIRFAI